MGANLNFEAIKSFLQTTHKVEGFMKRNSTCYILEVKESDPFNINDFLIPEKSNCGSWHYIWVATEGTIAKGKLVAVPLHKKAKAFLTRCQIERYVKLGVSEAEAIVLARVIKHKPFERNKLNIIKGMITNVEAFNALDRAFKERRPNQERYKVFDDYKLTRPVDYKTMEKAYHELSRFYKWKGVLHEKDFVS